MRSLALLLLATPLAAQTPPPLTTVRVASGLSGPVLVAAPPGDAQRLFIVEFNTGRIKIRKGGIVLATPFLDIGSLVTDNTNFGLLGLAFHPQYASNGFFYVQYVDNSFHPRVVRYQVSSNPDIANASSAQLVIQAPSIIDHQGGSIAFGPNDGYLYVGFGDGQELDPNNLAQNDGSLLGKLLRLDVNSGTPYAIPPSNPFAAPGLPLDEIWAKGLRNPFRFSFDRLTGDLYIGDVGQAAREEIDIQRGTSAGGRNYGWRLKEGSLCFNPPSNCSAGGGFTSPIAQYGHVTGSCTGSVTGGSVYRGAAISGLGGTYFFADFCMGKIGSFRYGAGMITQFVDRTAELTPAGGLHIDRPAAISEDGVGELYVVDFDGEVYEIVPR